MIGPLLRLIIVGTTVAVLLIGGMRLMPDSLPATDTLSALFSPSESCPTGCLLGIPPEITRLVDAVAMLQAHEWVDRVHGGWNNNLFTSEVTVHWQWSGTQPDFIDATVPGMMMAESFSYDGIAGHIVTSFTIPTRLRLYDLQQTLGPTAEGMALYNSSQNAIQYGVSYHDPDSFTRTSLMASLPCPANLMTFWHSHATLDYRAGYMLTSYVPPETLSALCRDE